MPIFTGQLTKLGIEDGGGHQTYLTRNFSY